MRLLIITQKVDRHDGVLGFFHLWIEKLAPQVEQLIVICLEKGDYELPPNVEVLSLGKESGKSRFKYLWRFYSYIWRERNNYDVVLSHMNPEYILLGWPIWKMLGKKITLWYAHGHVNFILRLAAKMANIIFTSTKSGCRLDNQKIKVIGQGIDVDFFAPSERQESTRKVFKVVSVGRISPVKDYQTLIKAVETLIADKRLLDVSIIGGPILIGDISYQTFLKKMVEEKKLNNVINFLGSKTNNEILPFLLDSDLFVNMSHTGSLDKAVLEAMSVGKPVLTCNEALETVLGNYREILMYPKGDHLVLAKKIKMIIGLSPDKRSEFSRDLRDIVIKHHSLNNFIKKIIETIK